VREHGLRPPFSRKRSLRARRLAGFRRILQFVPNAKRRLLAWMKQRNNRVVGRPGLAAGRDGHHITMRAGLRGTSTATVSVYDQLYPPPPNASSPWHDLLGPIAEASTRR